LSIEDDAWAIIAAARNDTRDTLVEGLMTWEQGTPFTKYHDGSRIDQAFYLSMRCERGIEPARRGAERLRRTKALWLLANVLPFQYSVLTRMGRFRQAEEVAAEVRPLAERLGHSAAAAVVRHADTLRQAAQSADLTALEVLSLGQSAMARATGSRFWLAAASVMEGIISFWRGEWAKACQQLSEAVQLTTPGFAFGNHHGALCMVLAFQGSDTRAWAVLAQVRDSLPRLGTVNTNGQWSLAVFGAEAAGVLEEPDWARRLHPLVVEALATGTLISPGGTLIQRAAGMAAAAAGLHDQAERHFEEALRQAQELPHLIERPAVRHFYAKYLLERGGGGDMERACTFLQEAAAGYRSIGMPRHLTMVEELLATSLLVPVRRHEPKSRRA
jgi:tetratricopeptide (TPR) repeat protein